MASPTRFSSSRSTAQAAPPSISSRRSARSRMTLGRTSRAAPAPRIVTENASFLRKGGRWEWEDGPMVAEPATPPRDTISQSRTPGIDSRQADQDQWRPDADRAGHRQLPREYCKVHAGGWGVTVSVEANDRLGQASARVRGAPASRRRCWLGSSNCSRRRTQPSTEARGPWSWAGAGQGDRGDARRHGSVESGGLGKGAEFTVRVPLEAGVPLTAEEVRGPCQNGVRRRVVIIAAESLREVLDSRSTWSR